MPRPSLLFPPPCTSSRVFVFRSPGPGGLLIPSKQCPLKSKPRPLGRGLALSLLPPLSPTAIPYCICLLRDKKPIGREREGQPALLYTHPGLCSSSECPTKAERALREMLDQSGLRSYRRWSGVSGIQSVFSRPNFYNFPSHLSNQLQVFVFSERSCYLSQRGFELELAGNAGYTALRVAWYAGKWQSCRDEGPFAIC